MNPNKSNTPPPPTTNEEIQTRMAALQLRKLEKEMGDLDEKERIGKEAQRQGAMSMENRRQMEIAIQAQCDHKKPNARPAIAGQKDHQHHYHYICLYCAKEWTDDELPIGLRIDGALVGGPN